MVNPLHMKVFARAESAEEVRAVLRGWLAGRVPEREVGDAELVATELVANSVRHAGLGVGELVRVGVELNGGTLRLEVDNPRTDGAVAAREPDPERSGGFGLGLVGGIARAWGVTRDVDTRVWVEMDRWSAVTTRS